MQGCCMVPVHVHPLVTRLFAEIAKAGLTEAATARKAGLNRRSVNNWRGHCNPNLPNFIAALNAIGLDLKIVPRSKAGGGAERD